jgi:hypothetical protein
MKNLKTLIVFALMMVQIEGVMAFCGFYVAKADAKLFNNRSEVILVRNGNRTVVTMSNDFKGNVRDFAMVVPVPVVLSEHDIRVVNRSIFDKLNDYSAPRLVEYYDEHPCAPMIEAKNEMFFAPTMVESITTKDMAMDVNENYGVSIEAEYEVGEYNILILSATESDGLRRWLTDNDYTIPQDADDVLNPYIKSNMKFFVVKVNLEKVASQETEYLSPIQITYSSEKFMLPIRLGMANADGPQDLVVYALTDQGRVECANYRTVQLPTDRNIPTYVKSKFGEFYKSVFERSWKYEGQNAVFLEYAWDVSPQNRVKCDPCVGPPPIQGDLAEAGVNWLNSTGKAYFTRLHVRYERDKFPQDLQFQVTPNKERYQARYVVTHPANGDFSCDEGQAYLKDLEMRRSKEVDELRVLTGWVTKHQSGYINEFSNRRLDRQNIQEERNEFIPVGSSDGKRPGGNQFPWTLPIVFVALAFFIGLTSKLVKKLEAVRSMS